MLHGHIKSFSAGSGSGVITPQGPGRDVFFLENVVEGSGQITVGRSVEYELYENGPEPEAKRVLLR